MLISARDRSCYRTTERKYTAAILLQLRNSDPMYWKQHIVRILETITFILETLLSLNANRIAGIAFSSFPGSCSLDKSTQEIFFTSIYLLKLCIVVYSMDAEPRTFLFTDFALRNKEKRICFKRGNYHFIVCSVSSVCILMSASNKYRSFSYLGIAILVFLELPQQGDSQACIYLCKCLNTVCYNIDVFFFYESYKYFSFLVFVETEIT